MSELLTDSDSHSRTASEGGVRDTAATSGFADARAEPEQSKPVLDQGDQGENLIPPSLILIPDIPDIPDIGVPWVLVPSVAWYPSVAAAGQGYRGRGSVARLPQGQERGPTARGDDPTSILI